MPFEDIEEDIIKAEVDTEVVIKEVKKPKKEVNYNSIHKRLEEIIELVNTGSKYNDHMKIRSVANDILPSEDKTTLLNGIDIIIDICNNPTKKNLTFTHQLKLAKKIKKMLE
jgi:hypothetical protein